MKSKYDQHIAKVNRLNLRNSWPAVIVLGLLGGFYLHYTAFKPAADAHVKRMAEQLQEPANP